MKRFLALLSLLIFSETLLAQAPANPPVRIRGTVEKFDAGMLTVKARNGQSMTVKMADNFTVMGIHKVGLSELANGKFIGTTTVGEREGALVAEEIHIFPENM